MSTRTDKSGVINPMTSVIAIIFMLLAVAVRVSPPGPTLVITQNEALELAGGCQWQSNPFLSRHPKAQLSAITYCEKGDEFTGNINFSLPPGTLRLNDLMTAGYIDGTQVRLQIGPLNRPEEAMTFRAMNGETWKRLSIPAEWADETLSVTLIDDGSAHRQWGGVGIGSKLASKRLPGWLFAIGIIFLVSSILQSRFTERPLNTARTVWVIALLFITTAAVLMFRRPEQLSSPYIWVEDGLFTLPQFLQHGWIFILEPIQGYLILPAKIIHALAMSLSAPNYPVLANWMNVLFTAGVICAIALAPTTLRYPVLCSLIALFIPNEGEVFGTSHYAFWWGSLLLIVPLLWKTDRQEVIAPRVFMTVIGGLSSPLVIVLTPLFLIRSAITRHKNDYYVAFFAILCALTQAWFVITTGTAGSKPKLSIDLLMLVQKFFGMYVYAPSADQPGVQLTIGFALLGLLAVLSFIARKRLTWTHFALSYCFLVAVLISAQRIDISAIHTTLAGPRYFFYPHIFLGWFIVQLLAVSPRWVFSIGLAGLLAVSLKWTWIDKRHHDPENWKHNLRTCAQSHDDYLMPIHFDGHGDLTWKLKLSPKDCQRLIDESLFKRR